VEGKAGGGAKGGSMIKQGRGTDFWWLTSNEAIKYKYLYVCHQEPCSDKPNSNKTPTSVPCFHSFDKNGNLSKSIMCYPLEFIEQWREKFANINVFRSLSLFTTEQEGEELLGPLVIDIDREDETSKGYVQNLDKALEDTRRLVKEYLCKFNKYDFRIFFTGHKGFNIEVRPQALDITSGPNQREQFKNKLTDINRVFRCNNTERFVDKFHEYLRLHNSINRFIANDGKELNRMRFQLSLYELNSLGMEEICRRSENLASDYLTKRQGD
jgi:hypothetical protein